MWFQRRDMDYAKSLKNWTHEGPNIKKEIKKYGHLKVQVQKNDEHMKAHVLRKKKEER